VGVPDTAPDAGGRSSLGRADAILSSFDEQHPTMSLTGITARTGLPKTTVYRAIEKMLELGWIEHHGDRYSIGSRLFEMASLTRFRMNLRERALPHLEHLYEATHETVHLAVLEGPEVLYVEKISGHHPSTELSRVGGRLPAYCSGVGKVLLAYGEPALTASVLEAPLAARTPATITRAERLRAELDRVRADGLAFDREECEPGLACVAAPVLGPTGVCVSAVSITGPVGRLRLDRLAPAVRTTALAIGHALRTSTDRPEETS
jgi:DNA-binding IclR family transcriptional regulator